MTHRPLVIAALLAVGVLTAGALAGCGKTGELQQPPPLFGAKAKADYDAQKQAEAEAQAAKRASPDPDALNPADRPLTQAPYAAPIPGGSNPFGQGAPTPVPGTSPADQ